MHQRGNSQLNWSHCHRVIPVRCCAVTLALLCSLSLRYALGSLLCSQSHDVPLPFLQPEFPCVHADLAVGAGNSLASYEGRCSLCRFLLAKESYTCFLVGPPQRGAHENSRLMQRLSTCRKEPRGRGPGRPGQRLLVAECCRNCRSRWEWRSRSIRGCPGPGRKRINGRGCGWRPGRPGRPGQRQRLAAAEPSGLRPPGSFL